MPICLGVCHFFGSLGFWDLGDLFRELSRTSLSPAVLHLTYSWRSWAAGRQLACRGLSPNSEFTPCPSCMGHRCLVGKCVSTLHSRHEHGVLLGTWEAEGKGGFPMQRPQLEVGSAQVVSWAAGLLRAKGNLSPLIRDSAEGSRVAASRANKDLTQPGQCEAVG